jgi:hypothetical protein
LSWEFGDGQAARRVFVDDAAEDAVAMDGVLGPDDGGGVVVWWALFAALVWAVIVEMTGEFVQDAGGVAFVVDQHPVGAL